MSTSFKISPDLSAVHFESSPQTLGKTYESWVITGSLTFTLDLIKQRNSQGLNKMMISDQKNWGDISYTALAASVIGIGVKISSIIEELEPILLLAMV